MRFWSFAVLMGTLSLPLSLVAQHTVAPAPPPSPAVSHVAPMPSTPPPAIHTPSIPATRMPVAPSPTGAHAVSSAAKPAHDLRATSLTGKQQESAARPNPERRGLFSFLRKHEPIPPDSPNKCKDDRCSTDRSFPPASLFASAPWIAPGLPPHRRCMRVPNK